MPKSAASRLPGEGLALLVPITETKASGKNTNKDSRSTPSGTILAPTIFACLVVCPWTMRPVDNTVDLRVHVCLFASMLAAQKPGTTGGKEAYGVQGRGARRAGLFLEGNMCTKVGGSTLEAPRSCPHDHGRKRSSLPHQHLSKLLPLLLGSGKVEGKTAGREGGRGQRSTKATARGVTGADNSQAATPGNPRTRAELPPTPCATSLGTLPRLGELLASPYLACGGTFL